MRLASLLSAVFLVSASAATAQSRFETPHWYVDLTDFGYSDFLIYTAPPFPDASIHEMLSGEWAAAIGYDGLDAQLPAPQRTMWLEPNFSYPSWTTNSTFTVVQSFEPWPLDTDGDGLPEGTSIIENADVRVQIDVDFTDTVTGTPLGIRGTTPIMSDRYVALVTYTVTNRTARSLAHVRFYQFLHGHPANTETPTVDAFYDPGSYAGALSQYRYDMTQHVVNSGSTDGSFTGCRFDDAIGFGADAAPADWGLGWYRGHGDRPPDGLHVAVENDTLTNELAFGPDEVAGAERWDVTSLAPGASVAFRVLLAVRSSELNGAPQHHEACVRITGTPGDPTIRLERGACAASNVAGPYDVVSGKLAELAYTGSGTSLGMVTCRADEMWADRLTVADDVSPCGGVIFFLARHGAGAQAGWGTDSAGLPRTATGGDCP